MGLVTVSQFSGNQTSLAPSPLSPTDVRHLADVERIAKTLARQGGAPAQDWPVFVEPAESLIRLSRTWTEGC